MSQPELYSEQDVTAKVIAPRLAELGFEDGLEGVHVRYNHPITVQQGRQTRTIFADIVVFVNDTPTIVIDAKNPRGYLVDNDREQVISYARLIGDIAPYSVLCNGKTWQFYDTFNKQRIVGIPSRTELFGDQKRRRISSNQRTTLQEQAVRTLFAIDSARELSRIMRQCHDIIRNLRGLNPASAFDELSKVLFCKMYEEREVEEGRRNTSRFTSRAVEENRNNGVEIVDFIWRETTRSERYQDVFSDEEIEESIGLPPEAIDKIVAVLEDKSLALTDLDVKGVAFEEFLSATYRGGGLGQYFTPRDIVSFMVDLVNPTIGETIIDPSCGTGGFLIRSFDVVRDKIMGADFSEAKKQQYLKQLANQSLVGIDWEARAARTCKMNRLFMVTVMQGYIKPMH